MNYIDLFAGCGGLSEGFSNMGFNAIAHVEMDISACETLRTRIIYQELKKNSQSDIYYAYLKGNVSKEQFYKSVPNKILNGVICDTISAETIPNIFNKIDALLQPNEKVDMVIGGPPCQAYSLIGRAVKAKKGGMKDDPRNYLYKYYVEFLKKYQPKYFVFENVLGLLSAGEYLLDMEEAFDEAGYKIAKKVLYANEYGVLQNRKRVLIIGKLGDDDFEFPVPEAFQHSWSIKDALLKDLPFLKPGDAPSIVAYTCPTNEYLNTSEIRNGIDFTTQHITRAHNERDLEIYARAAEAWINDKRRLRYSELPEELKSHKNQVSFGDRYKVVDLFGCCHTMMAHISKDGHYYIYPSTEQVRSLSVREAARIQSFPDDFYFEGGRTAAFRQIGNAVPPLMAKAIAKKLKTLL
jgi:DNA (cytosine-5)-methyltransferase 1